MKVSAIGLGTMTWGEQNTPEEAFAQMDLALEAGINFFDTAEMYPVQRPMGARKRSSANGLPREASART
jgi:aryl-alcohol dehydrogenase-like predicted oxidoreductase